jgi:hypothetical protein
MNASLPTMNDHRGMLRQVGEALFGARWQSDLSRAIGISDRTMRRWIADPHEIPEGVWSDISALILQRIAALDKLRIETNRYAFNLQS